MLEVSEVTGGYGDIVVVDGLTLRCPDNYVTVVLGPNGAGKTTALRLVMGLLKPMKGEVRFDGKPLGSLPAHKRAEMGMCLIPEGRSIFPSLTVRDNLVVQAAPGQEESGIAEVIAAFPALEFRLNQRAGTLSGGEQRMLGLARVYMQKPRLVLIDEPSLGLAPIIVDRIFEFLHGLASSNVALLVVEQYAERALAFADYVYVLGGGRVQLEGTPDDVRRNDLLAAYITGSGTTADGGYNGG